MSEVPPAVLEMETTSPTPTQTPAQTPAQTPGQTPAQTPETQTPAQTPAQTPETEVIKNLNQLMEIGKNQMAIITHQMDIITHLRGQLQRRGVSTYSCDKCGWVDDEDEFSDFEENNEWQRRCNVCSEESVAKAALENQLKNSTIL